MSDQQPGQEEPTTSIDELSFAAAEVAAVEQWASRLPLVNIDETTQQLAMAVAEVSILNAPASLRFDLVESLRPLVHYVYSRADRAASAGQREYSNTPAHALQSNLCRAYEYVFKETLEAPDEGADPTLLPCAGHRLLSELSVMGLRSLQYYAPLPAHFWRELNETYLHLDEGGYAGFSLEDTENASRPLTIQESYLRTLLLAASKPNQLLQRDLTNVYGALENWCQHATLSSKQNKALYVIDLGSNRGPQLTRFAKRLVNPRTIHTEVLAYEIDAYLREVATDLVVPDYVNQPLLAHLASAWSVVQPRNFRRIQAEGEVRVCVGLHAVHYFLAGGVGFEGQISNADELLRREVNPFLEVQFEASRPGMDDDPWSRPSRIPINPNIERPEEILAPSLKEKLQDREYEHFETEAVNTSPGGYCLQWRDDLPDNAKVGELIATRDENDPRWRVALIRWISREGDGDAARTNMGVELLSPRAIPLAARVIQKRGGSTNYSRALLLPAIDMINQPQTLITPSLPFLPKQKISIQRQDIQATGLLLDVHLKTGSFNQFTFRMLDGYLESSGGGSNIDALSAMTREDTTQGP